MTVVALTSATACLVGPLDLSPYKIEPEKLSEARRRVAALCRKDLIAGFNKAFSNGKRLIALIMADELSRQDIPPCFRGLQRTIDCFSLNQRFDLMMYDLYWLKRWHSTHVKSVRYQRYRELFKAGDAGFLRAAEYVFYQGKRPRWKIVASLSLTIEQQWECASLRSAPITKQAMVMNTDQGLVFERLQADLQNVCRSKAFTDDDARATLTRRHSLWVCSRMVKGSPAKTAIRYTQMTGLDITRDVTARQLQKIGESLIRQRYTTHHNI